MSVDNAPVVTPTPATIKPTSPLDIIPIPTFIDLALSLRNNHEGKPQPMSFVDMAIATSNIQMKVHGQSPNTTTIQEQLA